MRKMVTLKVCPQCAPTPTHPHPLSRPLRVMLGPAAPAALLESAARGDASAIAGFRVERVVGVAAALARVAAIDGGRLGT